VPVGRVRGILPVPRFLPGYIAMSSARYLPHFGAGGPLVRHASCFVLLLAIARAENGTAPTQTAPGADLFTNSSVRRIRIEIRPEDVRALRKESRSYVRSAIYAEDEFYPEVGVHLKGSTGSFRGLDDKPGLTLDFGRFSSGQRFHGLRKIHLNNSVEDPSYLNEQIASELFRAAGVPAPRVTHALVELNGRKLGLYVLKEGFTEDFLGIYFKRVDGNLYDTDLGDAVDQRRTRQSGRDPGDEHAGLELLAEAALEPELNRRWQRLNAALDMDRFITFMALEVMACHRDGYTLARNNFRLYHDPDAKKVVFFPHGMDQLFGRADLPWKPHMAGLLARSVMETAEGRQEYQARFGALFTNLFIVDRLTNRVNQIVGALRPFLGNSEFKQIEREAAAVRDRIVQRALNLRRQLAEPEPTLLEFADGIARLTGWTKIDQPAGGRMDETIDGRSALHIIAGPVTSASWRTSARLRRGRYRFEALGKIVAVKPLPFGKNQGAGLRIGDRMRQPFNFTGDSSWKRLDLEFQVDTDEEDVEFVCEFRASSGQVWFDKDSLRLIEIQ